MRRTRSKRAQIWAAALVATLAGIAVLPVAAHAQFFGDRWGGFGGFGGGWGDQPQYRRSPSQRFSFPFFGRPAPTYRPAESYRAPPPRKVETPPTTTVAVIGDSMADWLAYGLEEVYADQPQIGIVRNIRPNSGLVRYDPHNDTLQWPQAIKDALASQKPAAIIVMLGLGDRLPLRAPASVPDGKQPAQVTPQGKDAKTAAQPAPESAPGPGEQPPAAAAEPAPVAGASYDFHTDEWAKLYGKRIDAMIAALKSKGVPVLWVGLPAIRGQRGTADMSYLDDLYHAAADRAGITYVDIWDGFVDEDGHYTVEGPDFEGQTRRLRTGDGVHFTRYGALKLAHLVDQGLSHILTNPTAPATLPPPQAAAPPPTPGSRPAVGPVLPLTASGGGNDHLNGVDGTLLGGGGNPGPAEDPTAKDVLMRGDPLIPPTGRADDFSWPPHNADADAAPPATSARQ